MRKYLGLLVATMFSFAGHAFAQPINVPPPSGAMLDLAGQPLPGPTFTNYTVNFTPLGPLTAISFVMRADPMYLYLDDVSLVDVSTSSGNLITNGNFSADPTGTNPPTGWNYENPFSADYTGATETSFTHTPETGAYADGSVQAYDEINQVVSTNIGESYTLSFWVATDATYTTDTNNNDVFRALSSDGDNTNTGGNAVDLLAYATYPAPTLNTVPEPASLAIIGVSLCGLGAARRRRKVA